MEVGRVVSFDFLGLVDDYLDWNSLEILGDLDSEMEEWSLETLGLDSEGLDCLASYVVLPHFSS